jgi:hypothetical protein
MDRILYGVVDYNVSSNVITHGMEAFGALCTTYNDKLEDACMPYYKKYVVLLLQREKLFLF